MFELSPLETATNPSASLMPASSRTSRSNPRPTIVFAPVPGGYLMNASGFLSMTATSWSPSRSCRANSEPTRPQPITMTFMRGSLPDVCDRWHGRLRGRARREIVGDARDIHVRVPTERPHDLGARPIVEEALTELGEVPSRHHDGHLRARVGPAQDVLLERPRHVAVPALDHVERDGHPRVHPLPDERAGAIRVNGRVHGPDLGGSEG